MTRKHFETIAACFGAAYAEPRNDARTLNDIRARIVLELSLDNPRFNLDRFSARVEHWRKQHSD